MQWFQSYNFYLSLPPMNYLLEVWMRGSTIFSRSAVEFLFANKIHYFFQGVRPPTHQDTWIRP
ncbi:hypothetical protein HanIR_Chr17g0901441 [Helianthus annuus]|nr:hypothetical protein HanIR_Chr17g0901441 [Helianthus annuus]